MRVVVSFGGDVASPNRFDKDKTPSQVKSSLNTLKGSTFYDVELHYAVVSALKDLRIVKHPICYFQ